MKDITLDSNPFSNVIEPTKTRREERQEKKKRNFIKTPVSCAMCGRTLQCPDNKDLDEFSFGHSIKCTQSSDPTCKKAVDRPDSKKFLERAFKFFKN